MKIAIIGAGGHSKVVFDAVYSANKHKVAGFVDDNPKLAGTVLLNLPVVDKIESLRGVKGFIVALGDNAVRKAKYEFYRSKGYLPVNAIHKSAIISPYAGIGEGVAVFANVVINSGSSIGDNVILYTACTVDHDCRICEHAYVSPGCNIAGQVKIAAGAFLGSGAVILPRLSIGEWSIIGAGAVVLKDIPAYVTAVGVPAEDIKKLRETI